MSDNEGLSNPVDYQVDAFVDQLDRNGNTLKLYEPKTGTEGDINAIPLDDTLAFELYSAAKTVAVFQVESSGMMDALKNEQ